MNLLNLKVDGEDSKLFLEDLDNLRSTQSINILQKLVRSIFLVWNLFSITVRRVGLSSIDYENQIDLVIDFDLKNIKISLQKIF